MSKRKSLPFMTSDSSEKESHINKTTVLWKPEDVNNKMLERINT